MPRLKAILFDWDGTLFDSFNNTQFTNVAEKLGWPLPDNTLEILKSPANFGKGGTYIFKQFWPDKNKGEREIFFDEWVLADIVNLKLIPGALTLLHVLKNNGVVSGVVTLRRQKHILAFIRRNKLDGIIDPDLVQGFDGWKYAKPDPRVFDNIFKKLRAKGIDPEKDKTIYVGDSLGDIECTLQRSIEFIGLETGPMKKEDWIKAGLDQDHVIDRPINLLEWLLLREYI